MYIATYIHTYVFVWRFSDGYKFYKWSKKEFIEIIDLYCTYQS